MESKVYKINDLFWTVQGEGANAGRACLFVRLPFCNLSCSWCDTSFNSFDRITEEELEKVMLENDAKLAIITGGEPMMNKQTPDIVKLLKKHGFEIACESNGTFPIVDGIDFVTISPKRDANYEIHPDAFAKAHEFKYVVDDGFDFLTLTKHDPKDGRRYSLSPEFGNMEESVKLIMDYLMKNPSWRLNLQTHKWIGVK